MGEIPLNHIYVPETFTLYLKYLGFISLSFHTTAKAFPLNMSLQVGVPGRLRCPNRTWPRVSSGFGFRFSAGLGSGTPVKPSEAVLLLRPFVHPSVRVVRLLTSFPASLLGLPSAFCLVSTTRFLSGPRGRSGVLGTLEVFEETRQSHLCSRPYPHALSALISALRCQGRLREVAGHPGSPRDTCSCLCVLHRLSPRVSRTVNTGSVNDVNGSSGIVGPFSGSKGVLRPNSERTAAYVFDYIAHI